MQPIPVPSAPPPVGPPGVPIDLIDPLTGLPMGPPGPGPALYGNQVDAQGMPWPPEHWQADGDPGVPMEAPPPGAPSTLNPPPPAAPPEAAPPGPDAMREGGEVPPEAPPPESAPDAAQAGMAGMAAIDEANAPVATGQEPGKNVPQESTGDPYTDAMNRAEYEKGQALDESIRAKQAANDFRAIQDIERAREETRRRNDADKVYREVQAEAKTKRQELDKEAIAIAHNEIDPRRAWHDADFGAKLVVGIAAALQGWTTQGRAKQAAGKGVVDIVNGMCEQDMKAQQLDLENRKDVLGTRRGLMADDLAAGKEMHETEYRSIAAGYLTAGKMIDAEMLKYDNDVLTAEGHAQHALLKEAHGIAAENFHAKSVELAYQHRQDAIKNSQAWYNAKTNRDAQLDAAAGRKAAADAAKLEHDVPLMRETREAEKELRVRKVFLAKDKKGQPSYAPDDKVASDVNERLGKATAFTQDLDRLIDIRTKHGMTVFGEWSTEDQQEARSIYARILPAFSQSVDQGVIQKAEHQEYKDAFGDINALLDPRVNMRSMRAATVRNQNAMLQARVGPDTAPWLPEKGLQLPEDVPGNTVAPVAMVDEATPGVINYEGRGHTASDAEIAGAKSTTDAEKAKHAPEDFAVWESRQKTKFETRRQANIQAVQRGVRDKKDLPFPDVGTAGVWDGRNVK